MKRKLILLVLGFLILTGAQSIAQEKGQIRVGASLAMGNKAAINDAGDYKTGLGVAFGGDYFLIDKLTLGASFEPYFSSTYTGQGSFEPLFSLTVNAFNIDSKYYLLNKKIDVYGLLGLSFSRSKTAIIDFGNLPPNINILLDPDIIINKTGINIGGGVDYGLSDKLFLNGQVKYNTPLEQLVIQLGVGYVIK